jgi:hypothetical protein
MKHINYIKHGDVEKESGEIGIDASPLGTQIFSLLPRRWISIFFPTGLEKNQEIHYSLLTTCG